MSEDEKKFKAVKLSSVAPDIELATDIYLFINDHYVKFKPAGDVISAEKYDLFISKNVSAIYVVEEDEEAIEAWTEEKKREVIQEIVDEVGEEHRKLAEAREEIKSTVFDVFAEQELTSSNVGMLQNMTNNFVGEISNGSIVASILAKLTQLNDTIADHVVNTANLATFIAMVCGKGDKEVLEQIYLGAIFHDYAKAKISPSILEAPTTVGYSQAIQDHPAKGAAAARKIKELPDVVATIVEQHHEQYDGRGYPNGLGRGEINELAQIVSIANVYDNVLMENKSKPELDRHRLAIKNIEYDRGKRFDPEIISRVVDGLKLAFGNYQR